MEWESNYEKYILDFAQLAQNENIELFCFRIRECGSQKTRILVTVNQENKKNLLRETNLCSNWDDFDSFGMS
jgi:hypothetical protein